MAASECMRKLGCALQQLRASPPEMLRNTLPPAGCSGCQPPLQGRSCMGRRSMLSSLSQSGRPPGGSGVTAAGPAPSGFAPPPSCTVGNTNGCLNAVHKEQLTADVRWACTEREAPLAAAGCSPLLPDDTILPCTTYKHPPSLQLSGIVSCDDVLAHSHLAICCRHSPAGPRTAAWQCCGRQVMQTCSTKPENEMPTGQGMMTNGTTSRRRSGLPRCQHVSSS